MGPHRARNRSNRFMDLRKLDSRSLSDFAASNETVFRQPNEEPLIVHSPIQFAVLFHRVIASALCGWRKFWLWKVVSQGFLIKI